jgi:lysozyme
MSEQPAIVRRLVRHLALPAVAAGVLAIGTAVPAGAWHPVLEASMRTLSAAPTSHPPVDTLAEALAAGGSRADRGRGRTVLRQGIDVSHWQGRIDWRRVSGAGIDFAIAKATEGTWMVDPWYARNRARAASAGVAFTAYHFANPGKGPRDAIREADYFVRHAKLGGRNLIPALDLEVNGGLSPRAMARWTLRWLRRVEAKLGVRPMVYTSPGFWHGAVADSRRIAKAGFEVLWLSHWGTRRPSVPARRWDGQGWTIWQWTESGRVPGIDGPVDRNIWSGPKLRFMTIREVRREGEPDGGSRRDRPRLPMPR